MTFDYGRLFVISLLVLFIFNVAKGDNEYKYAESDERIHRLENYVANEILSYLRLLRLENEQKLRLLGQTGLNGGQQYTSENGNLEWSQGPNDSDWLQGPYDSVNNPGQMALWQNSPFANRRFPNAGGSLRSIGNQITSFSPDGYNFQFGQLPGSRKQMRVFQPDLQNEDGYQITSTMPQLPVGSVTSSSVLAAPGNMVSSITGSLNGSPRRSNIKLSNIPNSGQATINIDSTDSESTFETGVRSLPAKRKMQEDTISGVKNTRSIAAGGTEAGNKKYRVLLVNGDEGEEVNLDDVHKRLFSTRGFDSTGGVNTMAAAASSSSGGHPQNSFQSVSVSKNGKGATIVSSPTSKSMNTISLQSGDESSMSSVVESQPRGVGAKYKNSGSGSFEGMRGLVSNGFQNVRLH